MLFDENAPLGLTAYLGCLHAFVRQFQEDIFTVKRLAVQMEGNTRSAAFGWAASLDQARYRAVLCVDRWRIFNASVRERLIETEEERRLYEPVPAVDHALEICASLEDMLARTNRFIDTLETFSPDEVRMIGEMVEALDQELAADRTAAARIAGLLEERAKRRLTVTPDASSGLLMIGEADEGPDYPAQFAEAREQFSAHLARSL